MCGNLGNWVAAVRSTRSSARPRVCPRQLRLCRVLQAAGAVKTGPKLGTNCCWFAELGVRAASQKPGLPSSLVSFPLARPWGGLTPNRGGWSRWWGHTDPSLGRQQRNWLMAAGMPDLSAISYHRAGITQICLHMSPYRHHHLSLLCLQRGVCSPEVLS